MRRENENRRKNKMFNKLNILKLRKNLVYKKEMFCFIPVDIKEEC
jgi:hypothetical protein